MGCGSSSAEDETRIKEVVDKSPVVEDDGASPSPAAAEEKPSEPAPNKAPAPVPKKAAAPTPSKPKEDVEYEESYSTSYTASSYTYTKTN